VPETPEAFWARTNVALRTPPVQEWETWPFDGELRPRALEPPVEREPERAGVGGVGCRRCKRGDEGAIWSDEHWLVAPIGATPGLPMVCTLETRAHLDFHELPDDLQRELGVPQLIGSFAAIWDDVLPPLPEPVWQENIEIVRRALVSDTNGV